MAFENMTDDELLASYQRDMAAVSGETEQPTDLSQMSDDELMRSYQADLAAQSGVADEGGSEYGFTQRRKDEITASSGREASAGQVYAEGLLPGVRGVREGMEETEDRNLYAFLDRSALHDAEDKGLGATNYALRHYKAKEADADDTNKGAAVATNLPLVGPAVEGVRGLARAVNYRHQTDVLEAYARDARISEADIEKAREYSQGSAEKMNEYFAEIARKRFGERAARKGEAEGRLAAAGEEGFLGKVGGGFLGMAPMIEEFALTGAAGKALGVGGKIAKGATSAWRANVANGLKHSTWMTPVMGTEMATRRYKQLTAPEYYEDPETHELKVLGGDDSATALKKAAIGGYGEAAIFSLPIGEALFGKAAPAVTKFLRTKAGNNVANMYTKYIQYGRLTGLRGQPQMLALMDLNAFKDEVLGFGKKDADYEGFSKEFDKFVNGEDLPDGTHRPGTLSLEGQADLFIGTLGMIAAQGAGAFVGARRAMAKERRSTDSLLRTYWHIPQENLDKMSPEHKAMWRKVIDRLGRAETKEQRLKVEENLQNFCKRLDAKFGEEAGAAYENMGKFALQFDNSVGWDVGGDASGQRSRFSVPFEVRTETGKDGKEITRRVVPWERETVTLPDGKEVQRDVFTDPNTGISVMKFLPTDAEGSDNGSLYLITDGEGRRATRRGMKDALDAANEMSRQGEKSRADRGVKKAALENLYGEYAPGEKPLTVDSEAQASEILGRRLRDGEVAFTGPDGKQYYVLDKMQTPEQMRKVVLHEAGRHRGLDMVFGTPEQKQQFLELLSKSNDPVVRNQVETIMAARGYGSEKELLKDPNAMEEVFAHLFDHEGVPDEPGWWDAHMTAMRKGLRRVFHSLPMSRTEAEEVYRGAMDELAKQTGGEIQYIPEATERELMVAKQRRREENHIAGREAERDIAEIRDGGERRRAENEALGDEVQGQADAVRNAQGAEAVRGAFAAEGLRMGVRRERAERERRAEEERVGKEQEIGRKRQDEIAAQKAEGEAYDEQERQRIERERKEEQDAQDEAELQRMYDAEEKEGKEKADERTDQERGNAAAEEAQRDIDERRRNFNRGKALEDEADRLAENPPRISEDDRIDRIAKAKERAKQNEVADRNARLKKAGEEYDRAEEERKQREAEEELLPKITETEAEPEGKGRTAPQNDVVRVNYGPNGNQVVARRVTDDSGKVIGWDVNAVAKDGTETYIASTTKPKKDGMSAIRAVRRQIHDHFGIPYGKEAKAAMEAERTRLEETEVRKETRNETRNVPDEARAQAEQGSARESEAGEVARPVEGEPSRAEASDEGVVVHHANEGRGGDGVKAAEDALAGLFGGEGTTSRAEGAEAVEGRSRASDAGLAELRNLPPDFKFFDEKDELMDDNRRDGNQWFVNLVGNLYHDKKIRGFGGFARTIKEANPALWAEQKDKLPALWNYAAELSGGEIPRVGDYEARDAIRSADEGRNVRDVRGINALQAALQDIDVEMYPAAKLDSSDARVPNMKREADPKTGIIPGNELKGRPRSLLSKPILGVEFEDGTVAVGTGRHRKDLYERFGMDIPMRRVREADGWVTKKPDGTYDFTKIRLLDALDNIQDGKGSIEDYVAFFRDVQIPRGEAESEGFVGSKEARLAHAIANDAHPDIRAAINFEGGKVDGMIKPEQAAAIAEIAPVSGGKENADLQHYLLKAVQKDSSLDRRDLDIKASETMHMARVKQAQDGAEQMGFDFFGEEDVQNAAAKAEKYRAAQAAKFSRLAKNLRQAQRSNENDMAQIKIAREDMRELGINERKVAAGGKEKRDELQKAIDNALLQQMKWESVNLDPALRAQMEKDLGIAPKETAKRANPDFALESVTQGQIDAEAKAQAQRDEIQRRLNAPLKGGVGEMGQQLMDLGGQEGGDLFNRVHFFDKNEEADSDFEKRQYAPAKYKVPGAVKSRTLLEEPPALRATEPPDNNYKLQIPEKHIKNGDLQEHQLEFVGYAGRAHGMKDANGSPLGMMGGYGTGAGKSRMIAGTILDNRWRGRNRALWITTQRGLIDDVRSECEPFGMGNLVEDIGDKPMPKNGIGFTTYSNLRNEGTVEQIAKELGKDFDGVIAFDEIHRAKTEGGRTQDAVVKLQELLPKARVIYMSATGATDVGNLGYATRLGLWGEGTPFKDFEDFKNKVEGKGVSAMEMVARTLKKRGQYLSANLSKEGVEFDHVAVPTTERQKKTYTEYNNALKDVYKGVYDALEVLGRLDYTVPPSSLHGMQQRLHYSMVTAIKVPVLIERAKQELAKGNVPVFSLVNTNEAGATREVAKALEEGRQIGMDDVNFGPKQILLDFLTKEGDKRYKNKDKQLSYKDYQFPTMKPVKDGSGEVIGFERDQIADGIRRRLVNEVEKLPDEFGNPINMIIDAFGKDNVANLTGLNKGGMAEDYKAFQNGDKKVLVFSGVANTGYTFSSDRKYKNQARRVAFPLQLGFRADELEQTLGRVHRNNQANAPIYIASTTDLPGERRFYSSVERRRGQMKALTTGDRSASGNGITSEGDNFETKYAQQAVDGIIAMLHRMGKLDDVAREMNFIRRIQRPDGSVVEVNGMLKRDKSGAILPNVSAKRFLNRLLMLDPQKQDGMFTAFKNLLDQNIRWAQEDGEYDIGLQDIGSTHNDAVRSVKLADDMDVRHVNSWFKTDKVSFDDFAKAHAAEFVTYVRNKRTGETFAVRADGKMGRKQEPAAMRYAVDGTKRRMRASILDTEKPNAAYEKLDAAKAKELWDAEYGVIPDERADDGFYADGDLLKHWSDVLGSKPPRTFRVKAGDAPEYIGAKIDTDEIPAIFGRFGKAEEARDMVIDGKVREVLNNRTVDLVNGWTLKQVPRDGAKKVMVRGVEPSEVEAVAKELGGEVSKKRIFMEPDAAKLRKIIEEHPANLYRDDEKIGDTGNLRFFDEKEEDNEQFRGIVKRFGVTGDFGDALIITPKGNLISSHNGQFQHSRLSQMDDRIGDFSKADQEAAAKKFSKLPNAKEVVYDNPIVWENTVKVLATDIARGGKMTAEEALNIAKGYESVWMSDILNEGGIRVASNNAGLEIGVKPTKEAADRIWDYLEWREKNDMEGCAIDINDDVRDVGFTVNYAKHTSPSKILSDINNYFETGEMPKGTAGGLRDFRYFSKEEEVSPEREREEAYTKWRAGMPDSDKLRAEFDRKHPKSNAVRGPHGFIDTSSGYAVAELQKDRPYLQNNSQATNGALLHSGSAGSSRLDQKSVAAAHSSLERIVRSLPNSPQKVKGMVGSLLGVLGRMKRGEPVFDGGKPLSAKNFVTSLQALGFKRGEGAKSAYYTVDGSTTTRTSDHSANAELFVQDGTDNNLSIVIRRPHDRKRFEADNNVNAIEAVFPRTELEAHPEKLPQIIRDMGEFIATGEYHDTAGALAYNFSGDDAYIARARDRVYGDALARGDMETAERMVREAMERKGYSDDSSYQGTSAFNGAAPSRNAYFETKAERIEAAKNGEMEDTTTLGDYRDGIDVNNLQFIVFDPRSERNADPMRQEAIRNIRGVLNGGKNTITMYRSVPAEVKEGQFRNGDWITPSRAYAEENARIHGWAEKSHIIEQKVSIEDVWWDGNDIAEWGFDDGKASVYKNTKNNRKLSDVITYDDSGNVIPLSQRFDQSNPDIRFFNIDEEAGRRVHAKDYDEARRMEGAGADRREIWEKTGWWKAKDGKWRYEIAGISAADTKKMLDFALASGKFYDKDKANVYSFSLNDLEAAMKAKGERLPDSVKTLLKAYPKLGREIIEVDRMAKQPEDGTLGYATSGKKSGKIHLYEQGATAETLNHELQHRIQEASGMAGGTNTSNKSFDRYTHEHGEWEARQAATRAEMSPEERGKTAPWETADRHGVAEDATQIDAGNRKRVRADGEPPEPEPAAPAADRKTTFGDTYRTNITDRLDPLKQVEIETGKRGKKDLYVENSPYNAQRMLPGHQEAAKQQYEKVWKEPFLKMLRNSGVGANDLGAYMIAMNAKDRNRKVLERTGALDGAGISDADADKMIADMRRNFGAEKMRKIEEMADFLWKMQKEGMARRVESGRVAKEVAEKWEKEEPHHVPMRDDLSDEDGEYNRSTRQWRKSDFHEANGRYTLPDNPVEFMFKEYQDAMYGSNINEARRVLADFVRSTPGIGKVKRGVRVGKGWSFTHNQLENFPDPNYREQTVKGGAGRPNLVAFKEGGNLYMIELNGKQGERIAEAVIGRGVQQMWKPVQTLTRAYASTATELSPAFGGRNFVADMIEASLNTMADKGLLRGGASAVKNVVNAVRMAKTALHYINTGKFEGEYADVMRRYVKSGAMIGGMGNEGFTDLAGQFEKVRLGKRNAADMAKLVMSPIKTYNKMLELGTRLAVFKDYIDGGASDGEAAMRSREYSTDFNKYGNQRWMNSLWMFSGSVIGGGVRQVASIVHGKAGKQLATGLFVYGVLEALAEHYVNGDDDKKARKTGEASGESMTEYNRANSLYFRMGGKYARLPFHAGPFSVIKYAGNILTRLALGDVSAADAAKHLAKEAVDTGMHFTGTGDFNSETLNTVAQSLAPTLSVPFVQAMSNTDYAGRPIERRMYSETKPYSENGRKQTGDVWKGMARGMNALSGGNEKRRGLFDFSPEMYKHWWDSLGKNMTRDISAVVDMVSDFAEGKEVDKSHILYGRDYWRDVPDNTQNFYEAERRYKADSADGTIRQGSRRDEQIKTLLRDITTLRHWEDGEEKVGNRWVKRRNPSEATKEKHKKQRLKYQQKVIDLMNRRK